MDPHEEPKILKVDLSAPAPEGVKPGKGPGIVLNREDIQRILAQRVDTGVKANDTVDPALPPLVINQPESNNTWTIVGAVAVAVLLLAILNIALYHFYVRRQSRQAGAKPKKLVGARKPKAAQEKDKKAGKKAAGPDQPAADSKSTPKARKDAKNKHKTS